jgi:membrane-associated protease RseP (regulator of RpoE activity)
MDGLIIALAVIGIYIVLAYVLNSKGILEKYNMSMWGPFIMWRTKRGRDLIDKLSKPARFWNAYALMSKILVVGTMVFIMGLLIWEAFLVPSIPAEQAPSVEMLIGLPGINPIIPIWYGILGLVVAVFIHEFAHGILTRVGKMTVKALGIVFLVVPMGAFVEPDEEALVKVDKKKRTSVYAVGPGTNIIAALICALLFSSVVVSSAEPIRDNPLVVSVADGSPAAWAGLGYGDQIISVNGVAIGDGQYSNFDAPDPGTNATVSYYRGDDLLQANVVSGVVFTTIADDLPADNAGLRSGMILTSLNGSVVRNEADFRNILTSLAPGTTVPVSALVYNPDSSSYEDASTVKSITPVSKKEYFATHYGQDAEDIAYLGVNTAYLGAVTNDPQVILDKLGNPFSGADSFNEYLSGTLVYIALPFYGLQPLQSPLSDIFVPGGIFAGLPTDIFWMIANSLYWIFWINLMVGMTNALPAVPLDGGFLFKDWLDSIVAKVKNKADQATRDQYVNSITWAFALLVLFLIVWQLIGPRLL